VRTRVESRGGGDGERVNDWGMMGDWFDDDATGRGNRGTARRNDRSDLIREEAGRVRRSFLSSRGSIERLEGCACIGKERGGFYSSCSEDDAV